MEYVNEQERWDKCPKCVDTDFQCYYLLKNRSAQHNESIDR